MWSLAALLLCPDPPPAKRGIACSLLSPVCCLLSAVFCLLSPSSQARRVLFPTHLLPCHLADACHFYMPPSHALRHNHQFPPCLPSRPGSRGSAPVSRKSSRPSSQEKEEEQLQEVLLLLSTVYCLLSDVCCLLFAVCCPLSALSAVYCLLSAVYCLLALGPARKRGTGNGYRKHVRSALPPPPSLPSLTLPSSLHNCMPGLVWRLCNRSHCRNPNWFFYHAGAK
jgi:hypothetical protein